MNPTGSDRKKIFLAPMAGITDKPFRRLCRSMGADACVSEMTSVNPAVQDSRKSRWRRDLEDESSPRIVQIAGADPGWMAAAAADHADRGAEVIDINMGCPAKKVCNAQAGSALLRDERLVARILERVVAAAGVPVTLKIRTGWDPAHRNGPAVARIAEQSGIRRLVVHGRTRACRFEGRAEHDTVAAIKSCVRIPVLANGDIDSPEEADRVLRHTGADGVMIGRAALGNPWLIARLRRFLDTGEAGPAPSPAEFREVVIRHLRSLHEFYSAPAGVRIARKHIYWYCGGLPGFERLRERVCREEDPEAQWRRVDEFLEPARLAA